MRKIIKKINSIDIYSIYFPTLLQSTIKQNSSYVNLATHLKDKKKSKNSNMLVIQLKIRNNFQANQESTFFVVVLDV